MIAKRAYQNRSEAIRDLIRKALLEENVDSNEPVVGTLTLVYDHHVPNRSEKLTEMQHGAGAMILAATHVDLDHRQTFTGALSYALPSSREGIAHAVLGGFALDSFIRVRSGRPINILTGRDSLGLGFTTVTRPDVVPGVPFYLADALAPGGRRINPAAFNGIAPVSALRQETLSRNLLRGFNVTQVDVSVRRQFNVTERVNLQARVDGFNILNHANFADPIAILTDPNFGRSTQILSSGLGGLSSLYQVGGPRSLQVALRVSY